MIVPSKTLAGMGDLVADILVSDFIRLISEKVVAKAIAAGVEKRVFGYIGAGAPTLGEDGKYQVAPSKVRFDTSVSLDEIDLDSGFVMLPQAIPQPAPATGGTPPPGTTPPGPTPPGPTPPGATPPGSTTPGTGSAQTALDLSLTASKDKIFKAWNCSREARHEAKTQNLLC